MRTSIMTVTAAVLFAGASVANAQTPLRYAGMPAKAVYATADTVNNTIQTPAGSMTTSVGASSVIDLELHDVGDSTHVISRIREMKALMEAMGQSMDMPIPTEAMEPVEFMMSREGRTRHVKGMGAPDLTAGTATSSTISRMFIRLPAKPLNIGDTWTDTLSENVDSAGVKVDVVGINRGVYAADTTVDGVKLKVLRVTSETTMKMSANMNGMDMKQDLKGGTTSIVLFDPARNLIIYMRDETNLAGKVDAPAAGMTNMDISQNIRRSLRLVPQ